MASSTEEVQRGGESPGRAHEREREQERDKEAKAPRDKLEAIEEQIRQTEEEYEKVAEVVERLKIINGLLYDEVCKEYADLGQEADELGFQ